MTLFAAIFVPEALREATSDRAWLEAMLAAERALANAEAQAGVIPAAAAAAIVEHCDPDRFEPEQLAEAGRSSGNPAEPLARALRAAVGGDAARYVHWGATSQDIIDTAAMLVARRALGSVLDELERVAAACAHLADTYRTTPMAARTLLQHAVPTTFGLKAASWLVGVLDANANLLRVHSERLAAELGGAAGTLAALGRHGPEVTSLFAAQLELPEAELPWHTNRTRIAELGAALAIAAGAVAKIAVDIALLAQTEVGEVSEPPGGGSSTMPQKRNPVRSTLALACARQVTAHAAVLTASLVQEHERAIGAWHAEWDALSSALALTGGGAAAVADAVEGLEVNVERMARNLDSNCGAIVAERVALALADRLGRSEAHELLFSVTERAAAAGTSLAAELAAELDDDDRVDLSAEELQELLDPVGYLGSAELYVERALVRYRAGIGE